MSAAVLRRGHEETECLFCEGSCTLAGASQLCVYECTTIGIEVLTHHYPTVPCPYKTTRLKIWAQIESQGQNLFDKYLHCDDVAV